MCGTDIFLGILAVFFPPLAVWVKRGVCGADSLINIALCCLAYLPGLLHAWYIIAVTPDPTYEALAQQDAERGAVTYYYVQTQPQPQYAADSSRPGYGTVNATAPKSQPQPQAVAAPPPHAAGPSSHDAPPPSYQQATGDHKIQGP